MTPITLLLLLLCSPNPIFSLSRQDWVGRRSEPPRVVPQEGYHNPMANGGSMLTQVENTFPAGQGEPINAIISGNSDARVLVDTETNGGMRNYFLSMGFSGECLGQHSGSDQAANLGDGNGYKNETSVIRWNYGDAALGACKETIQGGNHFRYWIQNGRSGNSGAIFMAVSYELPIAQQHDIIANGYNLGRDWLIGNITRSVIPTDKLTNESSYSGTTSNNGYTYQTDIKYVPGLLSNTSMGINHNITVGLNGISAVDGLVAVLDVKISAAPQKNADTQHWKPSPLLLLTFLIFSLPLLTCI